MSDIYHKDTKKALVKFVDLYNDLEGVLTSDYIGCFELLAGEVQGLLDEYEERCDRIEDLEEQLENKDK